MQDDKRKNQDTDSQNTDLNPNGNVSQDQFSKGGSMAGGEPQDRSRDAGTSDDLEKIDTEE